MDCGNDAAFESLRRADSDLSGVFLNSKGTSLTSHREWFDPAVEEAAVEGYTWHKSRLPWRRAWRWPVDIRTLARLMGHCTIQMSMRYAHLSLDRNQSAVDRLVDFESKGTPKRTSSKKHRKR